MCNSHTDFLSAIDSLRWFSRRRDPTPHFWGLRARVAMTPKFKLNQHYCTEHLPTKSHHSMFTRSETIALTNRHCWKHPMLFTTLLCWVKTSRPVIWPDSGVIVEIVSQMVGYEVFAGSSQVNRIPPFKLCLQSVENGLWQTWAGRYSNVFEVDVIPDIQGHVFGPDNQHHTTPDNHVHRKILVPYSFISVGYGADPGFLAVSPQVTLVINPVVGCHYFPLSPQLLSQPKKSPPWPLPNYIAWWQRHTGVSSLPKATTQWCPARTRTHDL